MTVSDVAVKLALVILVLYLTTRFYQSLLRRYKKSTNEIAKMRLKPLFLSKDQLVNHKKFAEIFDGKDRIAEPEVPGAKQPSKVCQATDLTRLSTLEVIGFVFTIHLAGFSFGGNISAEHLMVTYTGSVRGLLGSWKSLEKLTDENRKLDAACIAAIILDCIFSGVAEHELPFDIKDLVSLLKNFEPDLMEAVLQHPSLKTEEDALGHFIKLYQELLQIEKTNQAAYANIIGQLPFCELDKAHWKYKAQQNIYLENILRFNSKRRLPPLTDSDVVQITRIIAVEPELSNLMSERFQASLALWNTVLSSADIAAAPPPETDRATFFRVVLDEMKLNYGNDGGSFVRNVRNGGQHLIEGQSISTGTQAGTIILFQYFQIMHMFNCTFPQLFCKFFRAMHTQGLVQKSTEKTLPHLILNS